MGGYVLHNHPSVLWAIHKLQGAAIECSPPLLHSYIVEGVTILLSHPVFCSQQGRTSCWKHILKFEPSLTTFYYIKSLQKYEATSQKNEKVSLNGF